MSTLDYVNFDATAGSKYAVLGKIQGYSDDKKIFRSEEKIKNFPADVFFKMDKQFKKNITLADVHRGIDSMIVVSEKLKDFLEERIAKDVQFLKVGIMNLKDEVISNSYYIVKPLKTVDCIDKDKSAVTWNSIDPDLISFCNGLVFSAEALKFMPGLFNTKHLYRRLFLKTEIANEMESNFTGVRFTEIDEITD